VSEPVSIGAITIGQSPRPDLLARLRSHLQADGVTVVEMGALDALSVADLPGPAAGGYPLTTRLRDGSAVTVDEAFLERAAALLRRLGSRASDRVEQTIQEI